MDRPAMQERGPVDLQGGGMKRLATRVYTFQELMNRIDLEYWRVHHHGQEQYTFVPVRYKGK
jgi:hypothetical protein